MIKNKRIYTVNSRSRISGTDEDFLFKIDLPKGEKFDRVALLDASIPKSYYLVQSGRNTFTLTETAGSATVTITPGNYSRKEFRTVLESKLTAASTGLSGWTYTVTIPSAPDTGKFTYAAAGGAGAQPAIVVTTYLFEQLGFSQNTTNTFVAGSLTSTNVVKFQAEDNLFIHSDIVGGGQDDTLQHIQAGSTVDYGTINYECREVDSNSRQLGSAENNVFRFSLTDEDKVTMSLNGLNMVFTLVIYRRDPVFDLIKHAIRFMIAQ